MELEDIRALQAAWPLKPFDLLLKGARKLPVDKPYFLCWAHDRSFAVHTSVGGGFEEFHPSWIAGIDFDDPVELRWKNRVRPAEVV